MTYSAEFLTLIKAGEIEEEAARALTTFLQHLRRGMDFSGALHANAVSFAVTVGSSSLVVNPPQK